jgi:hypothetical protein
VSNNFREIRELRDQFIRAVYDLRDPNTGRAMANAIMQRIGLDPDDSDDEARYAAVAQYFDEIGYIRGEAGGYSIVSMSELGIKYAGSRATCVVKKKAEHKVANAYYYGDPVAQGGGGADWGSLA